MLASQSDPRPKIGACHLPIIRQPSCRKGHYTHPLASIPDREIDRLPRTSVSSGSKWEEIVGYSRAVRVGSCIAVSGTTATGIDGKIIGKGDAYAQTKAILAKIDTALRGVGASLNDVIRTRIFVTDIDDWKEVARAHREYFAEVKPAATMVEVQSLIEDDMLVEIEADAYIE